MGIVTVTKLENADKDADSLNTFINGSDTAKVKTRTNKEYPTLANAVKQVMETGGWEPFATETALLASRPTITKKAAKALDTKKVWLWDGAQWNDTGLSDYDLAKEYTLNKSNQIADNATSLLETKPFSIVDENNKLGFGVNWDGSYEGAGARQEPTDEQSKIVWGIADDNGNVSTAALSDGSTLVAGQKHEQSIVSGLVDEEGNIAQVVKGGDLHQNTIYSQQIYVDEVKQRVLSCFEEDGNIFIVNSGETKQITFDGLNKNPSSVGNKIIFLSKKQRGVYKQYQYKDGIISRYYPNADFAKYVSVVCSGQSLMLSNATVAIDHKRADYGYKIAGTNVIARHDANTIGDIEPISEGLYQTIGTGFAQQLKQKNILVHGCARGGTTYANLKKGAQYGVFENIEKQLELIHAKSAYNYSTAMIVIHGEADGTGANTEYASNLSEWRRDLNESVKHINGSSSLELLTCQTSSISGYRNSATYRDTFVTPLLQLQASNTDPNIFLVSPKYQYEYIDHAHISNVCARHLGEMYAKVYKEVVDKGNDWKPLQPTNFTVSSNKIVIDFHVPTAPLQFDTEYITTVENQGFNLSNAGTNVITQVAITSPTQVTITCAENIANGSTISYAFYNGTYETSGRVSGNRGTLKDSDSINDSFNYMPLNNWCVIFKQILSI